MKHIAVSIPTAVSGAMRLYAAFILCSLSPDYLLLAGAFFLTLSVYSLDRIEDYGGKIVHPILFIFSVREFMHSKASLKFLYSFSSSAISIHTA